MFRKRFGQPVDRDEASPNLLLKRRQRQYGRPSLGEQRFETLLWMHFVDASAPVIRPVVIDAACVRSALWIAWRFLPIIKNERMCERKEKCELSSKHL